MMDGDPRDFQSSPSLRTPPHNYEAEKALLGAILANNRAYEPVAGIVRPEHFADPINGRVFESIAGLIERNQIADPITLKMLFEQDGSLADVGGIRYLADLAASMVSIINAADYGRVIYELHQKRQLLSLGERTVDGAYHPDYEIAEQIAAIEAGLATITESNTLGLPQDAESQIRRTIEKISAASNGDLQGRSTGLAAVDRVIGSLMGGNLYIIGARPSMGKTALALHLGDAGGNTFFWQGEMQAEQCHARRIAQRVKIPSTRFFRARDINNAEFDLIYQASQGLDRSLFIDDTPGLTVADFRRRAHRYADKHGVSLIVADHIGKFRFLDPRGRPVDELGKISGGCKELAKELDVPVVLLVQLNRGVEGREDRRPTLSDLRDSGRIEEDADVVAFLYREAYYLQRMPPARRPGEAVASFTERQFEHEERLRDVRHVAELGFAKNRHGATETARVFWDDPLMQFANLQQDQPRDSGMETMI